MAPTPGLLEALPDYEIDQELGRGAMGVVYLGRHRALNRLVAIKELPPSFAINPEVRERFLAEAQTVAALNHPHVVVIHDFVDRGGHLAFVMEHLPNGTVWDRFVSEGLTAQRAVGLTLATLAGLQHAHERGVLHRDIKPENLIFDQAGQLKVTDFGIAQMLTGRETMGTVTGMIVGTPAYMSPEQAEGVPCGPAADIYASGAMLYEMLSGQLPFSGADAMDMARARLAGPPRPLGEVAPTVPAAVSAVVMRALERRDVDRWASAEEFGVALATAASETWGDGWISVAGVPMLGNEAIQRAATTIPPRSPGQAGAPSTPLDDLAAAARGADPAALARPEAVPAAPMPAAPVLPAQQHRPAGADLNELTPADVLRLSEVQAPASPVPWFLAAIAAAALAVVAILGTWGSDPQPQRADGVIVDGYAFRADQEPVDVDFSEPIGTRGISVGTVEASFLGLTVGEAQASGGSIDPGYLRWTTAGLTELTAVGPSGDIVVPVRAAQPWWSTAPFVVAAVLGLGGLASVQSNFRAMRSRRLRVGPYLGLVLSGAIAGAALAVLAMIVLEAPADRLSVAIAAAAFGAAALVGGEAYRRSFRRRRLRRVSVATARR